MFDRNHCDREFGPLIAERQAGALAAADADALDRHLRECSRCRDWEDDLRELKAGLRDAARVAPLDHPEPEQLAALVEGGGGLSTEDRNRLEQHVESCAECKAEWNVASRWTPVSPAATVVPFPRWRWFAGGAMSAAAAAALLLFVLLPDMGNSPGLRPTLESTRVPVQIRGAHHRAVDEATVVRVAAGAEAVVVSLTVEAAPGSRLLVDLVAADGSSVVASTEAVLHEPSGLLLFSVSVAGLPDEGEFRVAIAGTDERFRYPFRAERSAD